MIIWKILTRDLPVFQGNITSFIKNSRSAHDIRDCVRITVWAWSSILKVSESDLVDHSRNSNRAAAVCSSIWELCHTWSLMLPSKSAQIVSTTLRIVRLITMNYLFAPKNIPSCANCVLSRAYWSRQWCAFFLPEYFKNKFSNSTYRLSHFLCRIVDVAASSVPVSLHWFRIKALKMVKNNFRKNKTIEILPHSWQRLRSLRQLGRANIEPSKADRPFRCPRKDRLEIPTVLASPLRSFQRSGCRRRGKLGSAPQRHLCRKCYLFQLHNSKVLNIYNCRSKKLALTLWSWISSLWPSERMTAEVKHCPFYGLV